MLRHQQIWFNLCKIRYNYIYFLTKILERPVRTFRIKLTILKLLGIIGVHDSADTGQHQFLMSFEGRENGVNHSDRSSYTLVLLILIAFG